MIKYTTLETSKKLYAAFPEWQDTFACWERTAGVPEGEPHLAYPELERHYGLFSTQELKSRTPAYDTDYLLDKLPKYLKVDGDPCRFELVPQGYTPGGPSKWCAAYFDMGHDIPYLESSDIPAEALALLALELKDEGVL